MTVVRIVPIPRRHTTPDEKFLRPRIQLESREHGAYLYKFEATRALPVVDLRHTLSHRWLGPQRNLKFLRWMKKNFDFMHFGQILGILLTVVVVASPRDVGKILGPISAALSMTSLMSSTATASLDVLRLLSQFYEFWFFTVANFIAWSLLAFFLADPLRAMSLIPLWLNSQLSISMDTNFRTFVIAIRSNIILLTVLIVIVVLVFLQVVDVEEARLGTLIPLTGAVEDVTLPLLGLFENAVATLIPFIMRVLYTKRKLFAAHSAGSKLIRCQLYRTHLVLRPVRYSRTASLGVETSSRGHVLHKQLGISSPVMSIASANDTAQHHQQITLVALRLSAIDTRNTILKSWPTKPPERFSVSKLIRIYGTGSFGLALTVATLTLPPGGSQSAQEYAVPVLGFLLSLAFCAVFACASQRDMLRALLFHNFGFLFSTLHCSIACLCVSDMMSWDYRCWAVASAFLWFVWVQLLDAVTPPVRRQLSFSKLQVVPVLWLLWALMLSVAYASVFLSAETSGLHGRDLVHFRVGHKVINTKIILINRVFIMFFWMQRHAWNVFKGAFIRCRQFIHPPVPSEDPDEDVLDPDEEELSIMRGSLEYFCPFDTFPGLRRRIRSLRMPSSSTSSFRRNSLTGRHRVRRLSSATLLTGVMVSTEEQRRKTRRGAFGQRSSASSVNHTIVPVREKRAWSESVPGMISDE
ncbi:hypothetical protein PPTG_00031 [Phytophthora nicotianae INRA-310]|uniref:Transmembrane protein n=4 Tax=Phytophthora nicotianae TaxID=4792 RepID=W2RDG7_PHYN3|nr:hypothetical protein PPTG_00031 [Phytophthora nicotianae INRA-310]ETI57687.1 hypothetical protein F443_00046 [Phytophthora nicotianae P1569]ETM57083.1 hypothetical protein L914_00032 [Phytophthora nicotianae]ETN23427.1 hypothetical protein PPTG_00031 [Phytophthora nicotianae INRA-310]